MNNKTNNMLNEFLENCDIEDEEELNEKLQEFTEKYNNGEIEYKNTPLDDAYEILEKAENAKSKKKAIALAKKAYATSNACFDAILFQVDLEKNKIKRDQILNEGLEREKERLKKEKYFDKENIGYFYGIYETRPYMRGLNKKAFNLTYDGKYRKAVEICKECLKLNENDNLGIRYLLMTLYAILEEEKEALNLYKQFNNENTFSMLFPLFALYYKLGDNDNAKKYLKKVNKANSKFLKIMKSEINDEDLETDAPEGYYQVGDISEIMMYATEFSFLFIPMMMATEFIVKNSK